MIDYQYQTMIVFQYIVFFQCGFCVPEMFRSFSQLPRAYFSLLLCPVPARNALFQKQNAFFSAEAFKTIWSLGRYSDICRKLSYQTVLYQAVA